MTHFVNRCSRTASIEKLTLFSKIKVLFTGVTIPRPINLKVPSDLGLSFQSLSITGGSTELLEAWAIRKPASKDWVLLFHGYSDCMSSLLDEAKEFHLLDYNTLLVDFPGSGRSSGNRTSVGYFEGQDVAAALNYVKATFHPGRTILYGHSMGAAAILRGISSYGAMPDAIILECPFDSLIGTVINRFHLMGLPGFPGAQAIVFWASIQQGSNFFNYRLSHEASAVHCPALLMAGSHDSRASVPEARAVFEALAGPKDWLLFENAGHQNFLDVDKDKWIRAAKGLLMLR